MQSSQPSVFLRDDTLLGVCEALGEDFGFNPFWLRVTLAVLLLWNPVAVIAGYVAAAFVIGISRWLVPNPRAATAAQAPDSGEGAAAADGEAQVAADDMALAA